VLTEIFTTLHLDERVVLEGEAGKVHLSWFFRVQISHSEYIRIAGWSLDLQILVFFLTILSQYSHVDSAEGRVMTVIIAQVNVLQLVGGQRDDPLLGGVQNVASVAVWVELRDEGSRVVAWREALVVDNTLAESKIVSNSLNHILVKGFVKQI